MSVSSSDTATDKTSLSGAGILFLHKTHIANTSRSFSKLKRRDMLTYNKAKKKVRKKTLYKHSNNIKENPCLIGHLQNT